MNLNLAAPTSLPATILQMLITTMGVVNTALARDVWMNRPATTMQRPRATMVRAPIPKPTTMLFSCLNDADGDGTCDEFEVLGCTNETACNYSSNATDDDGTCEYESCAGCTNPIACNYDMDATSEDGSCFYVVDGYDYDGVVTDTWQTAFAMNSKSPDVRMLRPATTTKQTRKRMEAATTALAVIQ